MLFSTRDRKLDLSDLAHIFNSSDIFDTDLTGFYLISLSVKYFARKF